MDMADNNFESRFFDLLQKNLDSLGDQVSAGFASANKRLDENTVATTKLTRRVDKLDGKVFKNKRPTSLANLIQDKQIIVYFLFALGIFLLILASVLHVRVPSL